MQGVGICLNALEWKDPDILDQMIDEGVGSEFYAEDTPNGVTALIEFTLAGDDDGTEDYYLITHNYKAYQQTPFNSEEELKDFYVRALREHVEDSDDEIRNSIEDIDMTFSG